MTDNNVTDITGAPVEVVTLPELDVNFFVFDEDKNLQYKFSVRGVNLQVSDSMVIIVDPVSEETRIFPINQYANISVKEAPKEEKGNPEIYTGEE